jgi:hypothetical protein
LIASIQDAGSAVAHVAPYSVALHGVHDVAGALDQRQAGGLAVHAGAEGADNGVGALDGAVHGRGVVEFADDDGDVVAPGGGHLGGVADVSGDGVPVGAELVDDLPADAAGGAEDGDVHGMASWLVCGSCVGSGAGDRAERAGVARPAAGGSAGDEDLAQRAVGEEGEGLVAGDRRPGGRAPLVGGLGIVAAAPVTTALAAVVAASTGRSYRHRRESGRVPVS